MSLIKKVGRKIVYGLGIKKVPVMTKVEQCRARGVKIGDNVDSDQRRDRLLLWTSYNHWK